MHGLCHENATEAELADFCTQPESERLGPGSALGVGRVVKLSDKAVIKYGEEVNEEEARNLETARALLHPDIVRVPRLFRFFNRAGVGYIVMEYIDGRIVEPSEYPAFTKSVGEILNRLHQIRGSAPGPLNGGVSRGILWITDLPRFGTIQTMEDCLNVRLLSQGHIRLANCDLVFCHLDIVPRNILKLQDGSLCLIDWASAGFYPRTFEAVELKIMMGQDDDFNRLVLQHLKPFSDEEVAQMELVMKAWNNSQHFHFKPTEISVLEYLTFPNPVRKPGWKPHPVPPIPS